MHPVRYLGTGVFLDAVKAETLRLMNQGCLEPESTRNGWIRAYKPPSPASHRDTELLRSYATFEKWRRLDAAHLEGPKPWH